jgi:hypothetical protein
VTCYISVISSANKTDRQNITQILLKEVLNTITLSPFNGIKWPELYWDTNSQLRFSNKLPSCNSNTLIIADRNWHSRRTNHKLEVKSHLFYATIFLLSQRWPLITRWLLFNTRRGMFHLYHSMDKLSFNEMMIYLICIRPKHLVGFS